MKNGDNEVKYFELDYPKLPIQAITDLKKLLKLKEVKDAIYREKFVEPVHITKDVVSIKIPLLYAVNGKPISFDVIEKIIDTFSCLVKTGFCLPTFKDSVDKYSDVYIKFSYLSLLMYMKLSKFCERYNFDGGGNKKYRFQLESVDFKKSSVFDDDDGGVTDVVVRMANEHVGLYLNWYGVRQIFDIVDITVYA